MSISNIKSKLKNNSKQDTSWKEKAKWRKENEEWLDISFEIAVRVMSALKTNKSSNKFPKNQKELAAALDCTPQYVSKLLKGQERLGIDTITKVGRILGVKLIEVPKEKVPRELVVENTRKFSKPIKAKKGLFFNYKIKKNTNESFSVDYKGNAMVSTYSTREHLKIVA